MQWQCRIAPSLGSGFAGTAHEAWGTVPYTDNTKPCVFFGMYGMRDYQAYLMHEGERAILWAGSDIRNLHNGYWLDANGDWKLKEKMLFDSEHYCENWLEAIVLTELGIQATVVPSFLGNIDHFQPQEINSTPRYYTSVSGDDFELYGWNEIDSWAEQYPEVEFHLFGNTQPWISYYKNIHVHGRVSQEDMDTAIKSMTGALRLTRFDGFSEILAKSILWGQQPVSPYIQYPFVAQNIGDTIDNARTQLLEVVNRYPWYANNK